MLTLRRRSLMCLGASKVNVRDLVFSYTGTWTDTEMEMNGQLYRVLQLKSNGSLTLDPRMVNRIPFDVWCVGTGKSGSAGSNDYSYVGEASCFSCGVWAMSQYSSSRGANGAAGGWNMTLDVIASALEYVASIAVAAANLGDLAAVSGTTRTGTAWFTLPTTNNGAGGTGGSGGYYYGVCGNCGASTGIRGYPGAGSPGTTGIVVIRIPIEEE